MLIVRFINIASKSVHQYFKREHYTMTMSKEKEHTIVVTTQYVDQKVGNYTCIYIIYLLSADDNVLRTPRNL